MKKNDKTRGVNAPILIIHIKACKFPAITKTEIGYAISANINELITPTKAKRPIALYPFKIALQYINNIFNNIGSANHRISEIAVLSIRPNIIPEINGAKNVNKQHTIIPMDNIIKNTDRA